MASVGVLAQMRENTKRVRTNIRAPMARATAASVGNVRVRTPVVIILTGANVVGMYHSRYLNRR